MAKKRKLTGINLSEQKRRSGTKLTLYGWKAILHSRKGKVR